MKYDHIPGKYLPANELKCPICKMILNQVEFSQTHYCLSTKIVKPNKRSEFSEKLSNNMNQKNNICIPSFKPVEMMKLCIKALYIL